MPWWQLATIKQAQVDWARSYYALPPDACPRCGTPLDYGTQSQVGGGKLQLRHCPMGDGYTWQGERRET